MTTKKTIDQANSAILRGSWAALQRAARRARELAAQTGTERVVRQDGGVECTKPRTDATEPQLREDHKPYKDTP